MMLRTLLCMAAIFSTQVVAQEIDEDAVVFKGIVTSDAQKYPMLFLVGDWPRQDLPNGKRLIIVSAKYPDRWWREQIAFNCDDRYISFRGHDGAANWGGTPAKPPEVDSWNLVSKGFNDWILAKLICDGESDGSVLGYGSAWNLAKNFALSGGKMGN